MSRHRPRTRFVNGEYREIKYSERVKCLRCGNEVAASYLAAHEKRAECVVAYTARQMRRQGFVYIGYLPDEMIALLSANGFETPRAPASGEGKDLRHGLYVPLWFQELWTAYRGSDSRVREEIVRRACSERMPDKWVNAIRTCKSLVIDDLENEYVSSEKKDDAIAALVGFQLCRDALHPVVYVDGSVCCPQHLSTFWTTVPASKVHYVALPKFGRPAMRTGEAPDAEEEGS